MLRGVRGEAGDEEPALCHVDLQNLLVLAGAGHPEIVAGGFVNKHTHTHFIVLHQIKKYHLNVEKYSSKKVKDRKAFGLKRGAK